MILDNLDDFKKECRFDWYVSGQVVILRLTHLKTNITLFDSTTKSRYKLQKKLLQSLWKNVQEFLNENPSR